MTRTWFKCECCGRECDNSVRAPENAPGEPNRFIEICQPCADSYCPVCDTLYAQPTPIARHGWTAICPECGNQGFFTAEVARTIIELNHTMRKEAP